jgi:hypothetical protein
MRGNDDIDVMPVGGADLAGLGGGVAADAEETPVLSIKF